VKRFLIFYYKRFGWAEILSRHWSSQIC
jgi:hypothetical protein